MIIVFNIVNIIDCFGFLNVVLGGGLGESANNKHVFWGLTEINIMILTVLAMIICLSLGIAGAISYDNGLLGVAAIAHCSTCCRDLWIGHITGLVFDALFIYPHASLFMENQKGASRTSTNERGNSCFGGFCDMVSDESPIPLI